MEQTIIFFFTPMSESMQKLIKDKKMWAHEMIPIIANR
jgi:hypothetical protein